TAAGRVQAREMSAFMSRACKGRVMSDLHCKFCRRDRTAWANFAEAKGRQKYTQADRWQSFFVDGCVSPRGFKVTLIVKMGRREMPAQGTDVPARQPPKMGIY